jgi:pyruvate kinase
LTRFRLPAWIIAVSTSLKTCRDLMFSYGVYAILEKRKPTDWTASAREYMKCHGLKGTCLIKAEGPSPDHPEVNHKMEIIEL